MSMTLVKKIIKTYLIAQGVIISETVLESICYKLIEEGSLKSFMINHMNDDLYRKLEEIKLAASLFGFKDSKHIFRKNKKGENENVQN